MVIMLLPFLMCPVAATSSSSGGGGTTILIPATRGESKRKIVLRARQPQQVKKLPATKPGPKKVAVKMEPKKATPASRTELRKTEEVTTLKLSESESDSTTVLFYDPEDLPATTSAGDIALPAAIFNSKGEKVSVAGKELIFLPPDAVKDGVTVPPPKPPPKVEEDDEEDDEEETDTSSGSSGSSSGSSGSSSSSKSSKSGTSSSQRRASTEDSSTSKNDQLIIISTVATMAILVGALSARRLRSQRLLNICIENESLEGDMAYDEVSTVRALGVNQAGYDTFADLDGAADLRYGDNLRWRGDLEKFDV